MKASVLITAILLFNIGSTQTIVPTAATFATATGSPVAIPSAYPSSIQINYVRNWLLQKPITNASEINTSLPVTDVQQQTQYLDGLGRLLQLVSKGSSPLRKDIVSPVVYDEFGREAYKYLPYAAGGSDGDFKTDPFSEQASFMQTQYGLQGEIFFYGKTVFEASPLNRIIRSMAPGNSWVGSGRGGEISYEVNQANEVRVWNMSDGINPSSSTFYNASELYRTVTRDEHSKRTVEYKDKEGKVVLKKTESLDNAQITSHDGWLSTYYVYDDLDQLRCVIQPKATEQLTSVNWQLSPTVLDELCFRYAYDGRRRMITKKVPGAAEVCMVYDARDRLVFAQDGNMRGKNEWLATLYDELNRPVITGMMVYTGTRAQLQAYADDATHLSGQSTIAIQGTAFARSLSISLRETGRTFYQASESIEFTDGFVSENGADFLAEIVSGSSTSSLIVKGSPLPSNAGFIALTITSYDDYTSTSKAYNTNNNAKLDADGSLYPDGLPSIASMQTKGMTTLSKVWVMEDANDLSAGKWLETANFYDDKGRLIQEQSENINGGKEELTNRYDFTGRTICTYQVHNNPLSAAGTIRIKTNMSYDHAGRLLAVKKQLNDDITTNKIVVTEDYDEQGRLNTKKLGSDPINTSLPLESLTYEHNIRGWIKSINQDFVNNKSNNYFGQTMSYDYGFSKSQYNGNMAGVRWRSKGDGERRAYGFEYDNINRLVKADFTQNNNGWNTSAGLDFSVGGPGSRIQYDQNGNILEMWQKGWRLAGSDWIDKMQYTYFSNTNKLKAVTDIVSVDNKLGDFTDKNTGASDYGYDVNGNLIADLNKKIGDASITGIDVPNGGAITYNHLNLPFKIEVKDDAGNLKGTITYLYDAAGNKLKRTIVEGTVTRCITYIGQFIYERTNGGTDELQFFSHEEGRIRPAKDAAGKIVFSYDYFIRDHLGNVRMVLTEQQKSDSYPAASMENVADKNSLDDVNNYIPFYSNTDYTTVNSYRTPRASVSGYPANDNFTIPNNYVAKTNGTSQKIGPNIVLKVMAGDKFNLKVSSWWASYNITPDPTSANPIAELITSLASGIASLTHGLTTPSELSSNASFNTEAQKFLNTRSGNFSSKPRAFVNWVLFDEQFKFVSSSSGFEQVGADQELKQHNFLAIPIHKNGYLYIYVSNETTNIDVFFDNLQVTHIRGPFLEENHYYPFGLTMAGISSRASGSLLNRSKFNDGTELANKEFSDGSGLELYETSFRSYDPQIGRFHQIDAMTDSYEDWSPYSFALDNPITRNDPTGLTDSVRQGSTPETAIPMQEVVIRTGNTKFNKYGMSYWNLWVKRHKHWGYGAMSRYLQLEGVNEEGMRRFKLAYDSIDYYEALDRWDDGWHSFVEGALLEGATWIGGGVASKVAIKLGGKVISLGYRAYKARRLAQVASVATEVAEGTGTTVIGHFPDYVKLADELGARRFQVPVSAWNKMSSAEQWAANTKFLDRAILRGDNIRLATLMRDVRPNSVLQKEINYLFGKGYKVSSDGLWLIK